MTIYRCAHAWVDDAIVADVDIVVSKGRIEAVVTDLERRRAHLAGDSVHVADAVTHLPGVVLPGVANAHSHAFHRALRGRTHAEGGTFWTWRSAMYQIAAALTPDAMFDLAQAVYGEMALAGVTCVGEFHYVHHQPDGSAYADPNAMGTALRSAAREAGIRMTLLDTCYLSGGLDADGPMPLQAEQRRFSDGTAHRWAERVSQLTDEEGSLIGAAIHSVRAVPMEQMPTVVEWSAGRPLHAHLSEQLAENDACQAAYGLSPTQVMAAVGALGPASTMVHATHLSAADIATIGSHGAFACFCPTTERDLADGIGPARALHDAGARLTLGSDQHAVIDLIEEARAMEMHERLATHERGRLTPASLVQALTVDGHRSLGWPDAGRIAVGQRADLVAIRTDTVRTAGCSPDQLLLAATAADVDTVIVDGEVIVAAGRHRRLEVADALQSSIQQLWRSADD